MRRALTVVALATALIAAGDSVVYAAPAFPSGVASRTLTPDGADRYTRSSGASWLAVAAPASNTGSNLRRVYWPVSQPDRADSTVCATWSSWTPGFVQPGLAHRITPTRAVTVTENVWYRIGWVLNVHTWNGTAFTQVAQFDFVDVLTLPGGGYRSAPWRVCSRLVGSTITVKVWFPPEPEPSWTDPVRAHSAQVSAPWTGKSGWYAGHIPAGGSLGMTSLAVR